MAELIALAESVVFSWSMMTHSTRICGIDLGRWKHQVAIEIDGSHDEFTVAQEHDEITNAVLRIAGPDPSSTVVLLEDPNNPLADLCIAHGCQVYIINPRRLHHYRKYSLLAAQKDDATDARLLIDAWKADPEPFNRFVRQPADVACMYSLTTLRHRTRRDRVRTVQRLQAALVRYYPLPLKLDPTLKAEWVLQFLNEAPSPAAARALTDADLERLLHPQKTLTIADLRTLITVPALPAHESIVKGLSTEVSSTAQSLLALHFAEKGLKKDIIKASQRLTGQEGRDWDILTSVPGVGGQSAATAYSHGYVAITKRSFETWRAIAGIAPVTEQSGTTRNRTKIRSMCNRRLRDACFQLAYSGIIHNEKLRTIYDGCRERGHKHARALRTVSHSQWRRIFAMLETDTTFDPQKWG